MLPGETKLIPQGRKSENNSLPNIKIVYEGYSTETARISVYMDEKDPAPKTIPMPVGFPPYMGTTELKREHSGGWADLNEKGQGIDLHVNKAEDRLAWHWYTFIDTLFHDEDDRRFYTGTTPCGPGIEEFVINTTTGGTLENPTLHGKPIPIGLGQISFLDNDNGVFLYNTSEHGRGAIELDRLAPYFDSPHSGVYFDPKRNGEGMTIQFYSEDFVIVDWFTYGRPSGRGDSIQDQRWLSCEKPVRNDDGTISLTAYEVRGGRFRGATDVEYVEVGTVQLRIRDNNRMYFKYDIKMAGMKRFAGVLQIKRII